MSSTCLQNRSSMVSRCLPFVVLFLQYFWISKVYVGQEDDYDNTALGVFDELVKEARLNSARGRTIYTNNYYTSMALAKHMFNKYGWKIVGTIVTTY